ncbi:endonuclease/exonuclease/phosphatase family protein [candidate division KSB1 bacterium]
MKRHLYLVFICILAYLSFFSCSETSKSINALSFNIRYNNPSDGENAWPNRKEFVAEMIRSHNVDIAGLQEVLKGQLDDLINMLPEYEFYGVGRDDGLNAGEHMVVFYRKDRFELLDKRTFWLSETPEEVSMGWDAACFRTVTCCKFRDKSSGKSFYFFNTHFDHRGQIAREKSAELIKKYITDIAANFPVVLTGDFNTDNTSVPYNLMTGSVDGQELRSLFDARKISETPHFGPEGTFSGFSNPQKQIDFVFVRENIKVLRHGFLTDSIEGRLPSDHLPVLVEIEIH